MGSGTRVLLVEDDDATREMLCAALNDAEFDIIAALDGLHALRTTLAMRPEVLVLDLGLPVLDGKTYLERWRERDPAAAAVPVIVMSAMPYGREIAESLGAVAYFAKPFEVQALIDAIRRYAPR